MSRFRTPRTWDGNKQHCLMYWLLQYPSWKKEYNRPPTARTVSYDNDGGSGGGGGDPVARQAIRKAELLSRMQLVEQTCEECCPGYADLMLKSLTEGMTWETIEAQGFPGCRWMFYRRRQKVLQLLHLRIFGETIEK